MEAFWIDMFLVKPPLPQKSLEVNLDTVVCMTIAMVIILFTVIKLVASYRKNRVCPCCGAKTKIDWRTEKREPARGRITLRFGRGAGLHAVPIARCPGCGWEIDLGK